VELKLRILVAAHAGPAGHRGTEPTKLLIQRHFLWAGARTEVDGFVQSCLECLSTGSARVRWPLGRAMHADAPNKMLHFDLCHIGIGIGQHSVRAPSHTYRCMVERRRPTTDNVLKHVDVATCLLSQL
jgi:Integrase zinc binding domain